MSTQPEMPTPDTPQVLLEHHLKALRLPTILHEYDKVARQCAQEKTDFPRYLLRLTELELLDRDRRATERRIRQARFPAFSQRYERASTLVTSNLPFDEWTEVFGSERLTGALLDRLTHHVHILEMNADSYRLKQSRRKRNPPADR